MRFSPVVAAAAPVVKAFGGLQATWEVGTSALARSLGTTGPPVVVEILGQSLVDLRDGAERVREVLDWQPKYDNLAAIAETSLAWERKLLERAR